MSKFSKLRRWIVSVIGILPLMLSLANIQPVLAAAPKADLAVQITVNRHTVRLGQTVTFTVKLTNLGPDTASDVAVLHTLPDQLSLVSIDCQNVSPDGMYCEYGALAPGETRISTIVATPNSAAPHHRRLVMNAASMFLSGDTVDPHHKNNADSVAVRWVGRFQ